MFFPQKTDCLGRINVLMSIRAYKEIVAILTIN